MTSAMHTLVAKDGFRLRGTAMSRIDGFSDVVFGFALTLLVVSLEVPKTYAELHAMLHGFLPFAVSFTLLMMVWFAHYQFFRRFGLEDIPTIVLNATLLFVVLFFVYPLKFLFTGLFANPDANGFSTPSEATQLMVLYGLGYAAIYFLLTALYWNGWHHRAELALTPLEQTLTRLYMQDAGGLAAIGLLSCLVAVAAPAGLAGLAGGCTYFLIPLFKTLHGMYGGRKSKEVHRQMAASATPVALP